MTLNFGDNLKKLRRDKDITQEELASFLGVTFQTVSKWERNENYPDITFLPSIASFFGVSVDELLGSGREEREKKIQGYLDLYDRMRLCEYSGCFTVFENAVREFPGDFRLLVRYMELLSVEKDSVRAPDYEQTDAAISQLYDRILTHCKDDSIRMGAKRLMIQHLVKRYECLGDRPARAQADAILATLPLMHDSREYLKMTMNSDAGTHRAASEKAINELVFLLDSALSRVFIYGDYVPTNAKIEVIENYNRLLLSAVPDALFTKNGINLIYNYGHLGHMYCETGDEEKALECLRLAAEAAVRFDARHDAAGVIAREYEQEPVYREMYMRERMTTLMTKHYPLPDGFRAKPEFQKILEIMK